jgi:hypothetical protein
MSACGYRISGAGGVVRRGDDRGGVGMEADAGAVGGVGSYLALLLPVCGLVQVGGQAVADRYAYLAMVPVLLALGSGLLWMWRRGPVPIKGAFASRWARGWFSLACGPAPKSRCGMTTSRCGARRWNISRRSAFELRFGRGAAEGASVGGGAGGGRAGGDAFRSAHGQLPMAHGTLGTIYLKMHEYNEAVAQLQQAVGGGWTLWAARYNLACAYARTGRLADAYDVLEALVAKQPQYAALAARDGELTALRDDPEYGASFAALVGVGEELRRRVFDRGDGGSLILSNGGATWECQRD